MTDNTADTQGKTRITTHPISPNSKKVYIAGSLHPRVRVPFREITLTPGPGQNGDGGASDSVLVYDTSGPYTDPNVKIDPRKPTRT